jgi:hypothetical protein
VRAPRANAIGELVVRSIRTEFLDHTIVINERHLHALLAEYIKYYRVSLLRLLLRSLLVGLRSRRELALENLVLSHQLQVALRTNPSPRLTNPDRLLWVWLRRAWPAWRDHLHIVKPEKPWSGGGLRGNGAKVAENYSTNSD